MEDSTYDPVASCFHKNFVSSIPGFRTSDPSESDFLAKCKSAILEVLARVEALPRDHWVWLPGYFDTHVHIARFGDYLRFRLRECPTDIPCLWAKLYCDLPIDPAWSTDIFRTLSRLVAIDADWIVYAAILHQEPWTDPTPLGLSAFLSELDLAVMAQPLIQRIEKRAEPYIDSLGVEGFTRQWASEALIAALEGPAPATKLAPR